MVIPIGYRRDGTPIWPIAGGGASQTTQVAYRARKDDVALNSTTWNDPDGVGSTTENTPWTQPVNQNFRVRIKVQEDNNKTEVVSGQLQASRNSTADGDYFNVTTSSSIVKAVTSSQFANDDATTEILTTNNKTNNSPFGYGCHDGVTANISLQNTDMENEYVVQIIGTDVNNGDTIRFRIGGLDVWSQVAAATVSGVATKQTITYSVSSLISKQAIKVTSSVDSWVGPAPVTYTISADANNHSHIGNGVGPFCDSAGNLYVFLRVDGNGHLMAAWKSDDGGQTWTEQDSANRPSRNGTTSDGLNAWAGQLVGDTIHLASTGGEFEVYYHQFHVSTHSTLADEWDGTYGNSLIRSVTATGSEYSVGIAVQSDGDIFVLHQGEVISTYETVYTMYSQNGGSSWSSPAEFLGYSFDCTGATCFLGKNDKIHAFGKAESGGTLLDGGPVLHASYADVTSTESTHEAIDGGNSTPADNRSPAPNPVPTEYNYWGPKSGGWYDDDGTEVVYFGYVTGEQDVGPYYPVATQIRGDGTPDTPDQVTTTGLKGSYQYGNWNHNGQYTLAVDQGAKTVYAVFASAADNDIYYRKNTDDGGWGSSDIKLVETYSDAIQAAVYQRNGKAYLGVVYDEVGGASQSGGTTKIAILELRDLPAGASTVNHNLDSLISTTDTVTHNIDSLIATSVTTTHDLDCLIATSVTTTHDLDALIATSVTMAHDLDALISTSVTTTHDLDSLIATSVTTTYDLEARLAKTELVYDSAQSAHGGTSARVAAAPNDASYVEYASFGTVTKLFSRHYVYLSGTIVNITREFAVVHITGTDDGPYVTIGTDGQFRLYSDGGSSAGGSVPFNQWFRVELEANATTDQANLRIYYTKDSLSYDVNINRSLSTATTFDRARFGITDINSAYEAPGWMP